MGAKIDDRIVAAARHLKDANDHLTEWQPRTTSSAGNRVSPSGPKISPEQLVAFYEYAHDVEKAMNYLKLAAIFESSLALALKALFAAENMRYDEIKRRSGMGSGMGGEN